jgi:SulP family sulfate permease
LDARTSRLREELSPRNLIPILTAGVVIGVLEVVVASSFAALIFSDDAAVHVPSAIGLTLFGAIAVMTVIGILTSLPPTVASVQDATAAILALIAASITAELPGESHKTFLTVVAAIAVSSLLTGVLFLVLGRFGLGDLVRFVPYPVVGGFLAGTGWLLFKGGAGVLTGTSLSFASLDVFARTEAMKMWLPGVLFAVLLLVLVRRYRHFLIIPGALLGGLALFYLAMFFSGNGVSDAKTDGWLLGPFPSGARLWEPWTIEAVGRADWGEVAGQIMNISSLLLVAVLGLLLNASGIEHALQRDADLNRELQAAGVANVAAGLGGGIIGFQALSLTALAHRAGAPGRLVSFVAAAVCGAALLFGTQALSLFPRPLLGGMILFLGAAFLVEWLYDAWFKLPRRDYLVVVLIVVVVASTGFLPGVAVGLIAAITLFVIDYSRTDVVKHALSGSTYQSRVERDPPHREILRRQGERVQILELQGFLFFGTANSLLERIRERVHDPNMPPLWFLVLDFRRVNGLDSSAVLSFTKVVQLAESKGFTPVLTGVRDDVRGQLARGGLAEEEGGDLRIFPDLDRGGQWCEDRILETATTPSTDAPQPLTALLRGGFGESVDPERLMDYLQPLEIPAAREIIRQGEPSEDLYFLESGRVTAQFVRPDGQSVRLRTMGPGTVVGEITMYLGTVRTASVVSEAPSKLYRLTRSSLEEMERRDPQLASAVHRLFARLLADRLTDALRSMDALLD